MPDNRRTKDGGEADEEETLHVAVCREADDLRSLHKMIGTKLEGEPWKYWDTSGVPLTSAVENLLALCGFSGKLPPRPEVRALSEQHVGVVSLLGFTVPASSFPLVREGIAAIANGQLGGFVPMVVAQSGFHDGAVDIFAYLWSHCGSPPIWICRPSFGERGGGRFVPVPIPSFVGEDTSLQASLFLRKIVLGEPKG
jgi:hypothetical protein